MQKGQVGNFTNSVKKAKPRNEQEFLSTRETETIRITLTKDLEFDPKTAFCLVLKFVLFVLNFLKNLFTEESVVFFFF